MNIPELLAPAGNSEKLTMALRYGADAVYLGGERYSLRALAGNFDQESLRWAVAYAHGYGLEDTDTVESSQTREAGLTGQDSTVHPQAPQPCAGSGRTFSRTVTTRAAFCSSIRARTRGWFTERLWRRVGR